MLKDKLVEVRKRIKEVRALIPYGKKRFVSIRVMHHSSWIKVYFTIEHPFSGLDQVIQKMRSLENMAIEFDADVSVFVQKTTDCCDEEPNTVEFSNAVDHLINSGQADYGNLSFVITDNGFIKIVNRLSEEIATIEVIDYSRHDFLDVKKFFGSLLVQYSYVS